MDFLNVVLIVTIVSFVFYKLYRHRFTCKCGDPLETYDTIYKSADPPVYTYVTDKFEQTGQKMETQYAVYHYKCDRCDRKCDIDAIFDSKPVPVGNPIPMQLCTNCRGRGTVFCQEKCPICEGRGLIKKN